MFCVRSFLNEVCAVYLELQIEIKWNIKCISPK